MNNNLCLQALGFPTLTGHPLSKPCMHISFMSMHETHNVYNQRKTDSTELLPTVRNPLRTAPFVATCRCINKHSIHSLSCGSKCSRSSYILFTPATANLLYSVTAKCCNFNLSKLYIQYMGYSSSSM